MHTFFLQIVTPDRPVFEGNVTSLLVRTTAGDVQILPGHADMIGAVAPGRVTYVTETGETRTAAAAGGFITVKPNDVDLVVTTFEYAEEIDPNRAESAKERAESRLADSKDEAVREAAKAKLERARLRLAISKMKK